MEGAERAWAELTVTVAGLGLRLDSRFTDRARGYLTELARWNAVARLTGYRTEADRVRHLLLESLLLLDVLGEDAAPLLDIGTGAGVPGLVLKMARPEWRVVLVEANRRRVSFLRHVIGALGLEGVEPVLGRAESLVGEARFAGQFRTVTMRAVAEAEVPERLALGFVGAGGRVVLPLGSRRRAPTTAPADEIRVSTPPGVLPGRRRFLIIDGAEGSGDAVPRGT